MSNVVNLAEEVLSGILQNAELLQGAIVAAEAGCIESLRWSGAMPLLLRDLGVQNVLCASTLLKCASREELRHLLLLQETESVDHLVLLLSNFLWNYEAGLKTLMALGIVRRLTVCSSLSEKAHECYDFTKVGESAGISATGAKAVKEMKFEEFALDLKASAMFATLNSAESSQHRMGDDNNWDWNDSEATTGMEETFAAPNSVQVVHLPLNVVPLLWSKTRSPEPSVFVLSHPTCASAFPLLLHQVEADTTMSLASPTGRTSARIHSTTGRNKYLQVKDVPPEHIPSAFRRSMRLLAYTLAEMMVGARLEVKEHIFALGATSLKIGHTLLRILNEMQQEATCRSVQDQKATSILLIDRMADLVSPCSSGGSLLDQILALLPQTPTESAAGEDTAEAGLTGRRENVTEIYPLHSSEPTPLSALAATSGYQVSDFVSQIQWKGGASLCHPTIPSGSNVFRSLVFRPAKLALRDLDKRLQAVEQTLLQQGKLQTAAVTRRPGEKVRGRDVVLRRISKILEAGEPTNLEHSSLIELGVIVLEALERLDQPQKGWDECRERAVRQLELWKQGGSDGILSEVVSIMHRQVAVMQSGGSEKIFSLQETLTLLVNAFSLSAGTLLEDFTIQFVQQALVESVWQAVQRTPLSVHAVLPKLYAQLLPYISTSETQVKHTNTDCDTEGNEWGWNEGNSSSTALLQTSDNSDNGVKMVETTLIIESYVESIMSSLTDCKQQCAKLSNENATLEKIETPRSLLAQLCRSIVDPSGALIGEIEHIVDASEQLTRAGIDLLKSGFSKFGFGGGSGHRGINDSRFLGDSDVLVVFIVGGITFEEIQEVHDALSDNTKYQIILGGTTVTNDKLILEKLFSR